MASESPQLPIPKQAFSGLEALIKLGENGIDLLCVAQAEAPLDLSFEKLISRLSQQLDFEELILHQAIMGALVPLNGLRRSLEISTDEFLKAMAKTVESRASQEWQDANLEGWRKVASHLPPLFEPNNFFSQASKALELLSLRPAVFQQARILSETRPVFDEETTKTLAVLQTNTLVIRYWDGEDMQTVHLTLDDGDLDSLAQEIQRAKKKVAIGAREASEHGVQFVIYGSHAENPGA